MLGALPAALGVLLFKLTSYSQAREMFFCKLPNLSTPKVANRSGEEIVANRGDVSRKGLMKTLQTVIEQQNIFKRHHIVRLIICQNTQH